MQHLHCLTEQPWQGCHIEAEPRSTRQLRCHSRSICLILERAGYKVRAPRKDTPRVKLTPVRDKQAAAQRAAQLRAQSLSLRRAAPGRRISTSTQHASGTRQRRWSCYPAPAQRARLMTRAGPVERGPAERQTDILRSVGGSLAVWLIRRNLNACLPADSVPLLKHAQALGRARR